MMERSTASIMSSFMPVTFHPSPRANSHARRRHQRKRSRVPNRRLPSACWTEEKKGEEEDEVKREYVERTTGTYCCGMCAYIARMMAVRSSSVSAGTVTGLKKALSISHPFAADRPSVLCVAKRRKPSLALMTSPRTSTSPRSIRTRSPLSTSQPALSTSSTTTQRPSRRAVVRAPGDQRNSPGVSVHV